MRLTVIIIAASLAGCSSVTPAASCHGPLFALNAGEWTPLPADLVVTHMPGVPASLQPGVVP